MCTLSVDLQTNAAVPCIVFSKESQTYFTHAVKKEIDDLLRAITNKWSYSIIYSGTYPDGTVFELP